MNYSSHQFESTYWKMASENYRAFKRFDSDVTNAECQNDQYARCLCDEKRINAAVTAIDYTTLYLKYESLRYLAAYRGEKNAEGLMKGHRFIKGRPLTTQWWSFVAINLTGFDYLREENLEIKLNNLFHLREQLRRQTHITFSMNVPDKFIAATISKRNTHFNKVVERSKNTVVELARVARKHHRRSIRDAVEPAQKKLFLLPLNDVVEECLEH